MSMARFYGIDMPQADRFLGVEPLTGADRVERLFFAPSRSGYAGRLQRQSVHDRILAANPSLDQVRLER